MRRIPLTRGQVAIVDDADYAWLSQWKWCATCSHDICGYCAPPNATMASGQRCRCTA